MNEETNEEMKEEVVVEKKVVELKEAEIVPVVEKKKVVDSKGIKESKEALQFAFAIGKIFMQAKKNNGGIDVGDLPLLVNLFPVLGPALEGMSEIPAELKDLDSEEVKSLLVFSSAHLGALAGADEELAEKIEKGLALAIAIANFVKVL